MLLLALDGNSTLFALFHEVTVVAHRHQMLCVFADFDDFGAFLTLRQHQTPRKIVLVKWILPSFLRRIRRLKCLLAELTLIRATYQREVVIFIDRGEGVMIEVLLLKKTSFYSVEIERHGTAVRRLAFLFRLLLCFALHVQSLCLGDQWILP